MRITLLNGRQAWTEEITFDPGNYHFYWGARNLDITDSMTREQKRTFEGFDDETENRRLYADAHGGQDFNTGDTTIWGNWWDQMTTDPLAAPLDALDTGVFKAFTSPGFIIVAIIAAFLILRRK